MSFVCGACAPSGAPLLGVHDLFSHTHTVLALIHPGRSEKSNERTCRQTQLKSMLNQSDFFDHFAFDDDCNAWRCTFCDLWIRRNSMPHEAVDPALDTPPLFPAGAGGQVGVPRYISEQIRAQSLQLNRPFVQPSPSSNETEAEATEHQIQNSSLPPRSLWERTYQDRPGRQPIVDRTKARNLQHDRFFRGCFPQRPGMEVGAVRTRGYVYHGTNFTYICKERRCRDKTKPRIVLVSAGKL